MKFLNLLTFTFILFITNLTLLANNNAEHNTNNNRGIYFETANKSTKYSFSAADARNLEKYLTASNKIVSCDQKTLSLMLETPTGEQNIVQDLYTIGYAVLELSCSNQTIVISLSKTPNDLMAIAAHFEKQETLAQAKTLKANDSSSGDNTKAFNTDCKDCGKVTLSQDILEEFEDSSYSGQLIDFGSTETTIEQVSNMQTEVNLFTVESENITCDECDASILTENMLDDAVNKLKSATNNELVEDALELELESSSVYRTPNP